MLLARKEIKGPINDNTLNSTNHNFKELYDGFNNVVDEVSNKAFDKVVESARLDWDTMVEKYTDLPSDAETGTTIGVKEDGLVYRYDGSKWVDIYEINLNPISEVDDRLSSQLAETDQQRFYGSMINRKQRKPMIVWVDDDGLKGVYSKLKPLAEEYNIPITSAFITKNWNKNPDKYLTPYEMRELSEDYGFEFISHTHNHDPNHRPYQMTDAELHADFSESQKIMRENGFNHRGIVFPFGASSGEERILNIARQYFDYAVGTGASGPTEDNSGPAQVPPINQYYVRRVSIERGFDIVKKQIDVASDENGLVILVGHIDDSGSHENWFTHEYGKQIIEYALSKGLEFTTLQKAMNEHGNLAQFGNTKISPDGDVFSDELGKVKFIGATVDNDTPIDFFDVDKISIARIPSANSEGFPDDSGGILRTERHAESEHYSCQTFTSSRQKKVSMRFWNFDEWSPWEYINVSRYLGINAMTPTSSPYSSSRQRLITYTTINNVGNQGFPENKSGLLINYAFQSGGFCFQEYHIYEENKTYKRHWINNDWDNWTLVQAKIPAFISEINTILTSMKPSQFEEGLTISYITKGASDPGLPEGDVGHIITVKYEGAVRAFQKLVAYDSWNEYKRYAISDGAWSDWKKYVFETI